MDPKPSGPASRPSDDTSEGERQDDVCTFKYANCLQDAKKLFRTLTQSNWCNRSQDVVYSSEDQKLGDILFAASIFEDFIISSARNLRVTNSTLVDVDEDLNFQIRCNVLPKGNDFLFYESSGENFIKITQANLDPNSVVLGIAYKKLYGILSNYPTDTEEGTKIRVLDSIIMSAVIDPLPEALRENVTLVFKNMKVNREKRTCVFWNFSEDNYGSWSSKGCQTNMISDSQTECVCSHLTHFAVLMDFTDTNANWKDETRSSGEHDKILTILTQVGMTLSLIGVVLTVVSYFQLTDRHSPLCHIRVSLTSCIGAGHVIFFAGIEATENQVGCVAGAALLQYFLMASFCWMLVEGLPTIMVAGSLSIAAGKDGIETYVTDKKCWMSSSNNIIWILVSFVGLITIINMVILVRVIKEMTTIQQVKDNQTEQIRLGIRACVVLAPLLGVTWLIGFLLPLHIAFSYIFVILNSTQIRGRFKRRFQRIHPSALNHGQAHNTKNSKTRQSHANAGISQEDRE